jgi:hypothetical protein
VLLVDRSVQVILSLFPHAASEVKYAIRRLIRRLAYSDAQDSEVSTGCKSCDDFMFFSVTKTFFTGGTEQEMFSGVLMYSSNLLFSRLSFSGM